MKDNTVCVAPGVKTKRKVAEKPIAPVVDESGNNGEPEQLPPVDDTDPREDR